MNKEILKNPIVIVGIFAIVIIAIVSGVKIYDNIMINRWASTFNQAMLGDFTEKAMVSEIQEVPKEYNNLLKAGNLIAQPLQLELDRLYSLYLSEEITFENLKNGISSYKLIPGSKDYSQEIMIKAEKIALGRESFNTALEKNEQGLFDEAIKLLDTIAEEDSAYLEKSKDLFLVVQRELHVDVIDKTNLLISLNKTKEAKDYLDSVSASEDIKLEQLEKINTQEQFQTNLELYEGPVEHVFTHCLIAFPELAYSSPSMTRALDTDCVTPYEFKKMLQGFYDNDYILIDINLLIENVDENGDFVKAKPIMLPKGKKPLVLSIDDVVYDARKASTGMVDKLIVDDKGQVATYTKHKSGEEVTSYDNEVFPVVNTFCIENPEFSFNGAKGTLALTGFQGILGYRTQHDAPEGTNYEKEKEGALKVVAALKENGWNFGSHSYAHGHMRDRMSLETVIEDTALWTAEVKSLVGDTKIFIYPYGENVKPDDPKFNALYDDGFRLFCMVGSRSSYIKTLSDGRGIVQDRRSLDGYSLRNFREYLLPFFDTEAVMDPIRPKEAVE